MTKDNSVNPSAPKTEDASEAPAPSPTNDNPHPSPESIGITQGSPSHLPVNKEESDIDDGGALCQ